MWTFPFSKKKTFPHHSTEFSAPTRVYYFAIPPSLYFFFHPKNKSHDEQKKHETFQINFYYISSDIRSNVDKDIGMIFFFFSRRLVIAEVITCTSKAKNWALSATINRIVRDWNINECQLNALTKPTEKRQTIRARERKKNLFSNLFLCCLDLSFCPIKISNESEIKFIFYLLFRWWFLLYTMRENSSIFPESREWGHDKRVREWKNMLFVIVEQNIVC